MRAGLILLMGLAAFALAAGETETEMYDLESSAEVYNARRLMIPKHGQ